MIPEYARSLGGKVMALRQREAAIAAYYEDPVKCGACGKILEIDSHTKASVLRRRKFCSSTCSHLNRVPSEVVPREQKHLVLIGDCVVCGEKFSYKRKTNFVTKRTHCDTCRVTPTNPTKKELFTKAKNWQSARSHIQKRARRIYSLSEKSKCCTICGFSFHFEVCHIRPVSDFPEDTKVSEINTLSNLLALCPTHHWLHDNLPDEYAKLLVASSNEALGPY